MEEYKKKYEEAILRMNKWVEGSEIIDPKEVAEFVFPELKESEEERIRKHLLKHFLNKAKEEWNGMPIKNIIAWLEKQGEQKPVDKCAGCNNVKGCITCTDGDQYAHIKEYNPAWSEEDEKCFCWVIKHFEQDVELYDNLIYWLKSIKERMKG